jgi:DNA-binding NarL/FixJ family response regulator
VTRPIRVVIADDHPMFRDGLRAALHAVPEIDVVGDAPNGEQLLELVEATDPDVVLTDLAMPGLDGVAAAQRIRQLHPDVQVLMLTMHDDDTALRQALQAGARGYLLKDSERDSIVLAVRTVAAGGTVYGQRVGDRIATWAGDPPTPAVAPFPSLTPREREILDLVAQGIGNHEIARRLVLSEKTIRNNFASILTKLQVNDRATAVARARDAGLGQRH